MLDLEELKEFYEARPFKPFELILRDGRRLRVTDPLHVGWSTAAQTLVYANERDTFDQIPMEQVANVRLVKSNGTGQKARRRRRRDH